MQYLQVAPCLIHVIMIISFTGLRAKSLFISEMFSRPQNTLLRHRSIFVLRYDRIRHERFSFGGVFFESKL